LTESKSIKPGPKPEEPAVELVDVPVDEPAPIVPVKPIVPAKPNTPSVDQEVEKLIFVTKKKT